jgi:hypothetical protein
MDDQLSSAQVKMFIFPPDRPLRDCQWHPELERLRYEHGPRKQAWGMIEFVTPPCGWPYSHPTPRPPPPSPPPPPTEPPLPAYTEPLCDDIEPFLTGDAEPPRETTHTVDSSPPPDNTGPPVELVDRDYASSPVSEAGDPPPFEPDSSPAPSVDTKEKEWEVESIVGARVKRGDSHLRIEYRVHWKGCPEEEDTWEPIDHLQNAPEPLERFCEAWRPASGRDAAQHGRSAGRRFSPYRGHHPSASSPRAAPSRSPSPSARRRPRRPRRGHRGQ